MISIRSVSETASRREYQVQSHVIEALMTRDYDVIFDDDDAGEAADIVAIRLEGKIDDPKEVCVDFYHCKFSSKQYKGARIR